MAATETASVGEMIIKPCGRAFFVYYVAIAICLVGPRLNPEVWFFGFLHFSTTMGTSLGLVLIALVVYLKMGREYRITPRGVMLLWRWPSPRQWEITWKDLGDVLVRRGLTQSILRVGNLIIRDKSGGQEMFWFGLANPKEIQAEIERSRP